MKKKELSAVEQLAVEQLSRMQKRSRFWKGFWEIIGDIAMICLVSGGVIGLSLITVDIVGSLFNDHAKIVCLERQINNMDDSISRLNILEHPKSISPTMPCIMYVTNVMYINGASIKYVN